MNIKINNQTINKAELLELIKERKLQAILYVKDNAGMGLKEAKEVVENLEQNPNHYDNLEVGKNTISQNTRATTKIDSENKMDFLNNEKRITDTFYIEQEKKKRIKLIVLAVIFVIISVLLLS